MYRFIQKHGKKLLAVFSAFLMVSFAASGMLTGGGRGHNPVVGRIGSEKIRGHDVFVARQQWQLLNRLNDRNGRRLSAALGPEIEAEMSRNPVLFLLLQKEAEQLGVTVSNDNLQSMLANNPTLLTTDPDRNEEINRAVRSLLLVVNSAQRAGSVIKVTEPMVKQQLAELGQSITLNLVDFTTAKYIDQAKAKEPTAEELKAHFQKYGDQVAGQVSEANPFGFGYKYPDRIKIQYIVVPTSDVRKVVEGSKTPYQWDVEARKHYRQNQSQFRAEPTTQAAKPFDLTAPASRPTTKPYEEVQQGIKDQLIKAETDKRMTAIRERLASTLGADWIAYRNAVGSSSAATTQPTTAATAGALPPSSQGVPYSSFEYLQKLAQQIQSIESLGVLPTAVSIADRWLTADELKKLAGIGQAHLNGVPMSDYLMSMASPFIPETARKDGGWLRVMEPTRPMTDTNDSIYIVRISAAEPAHRPASIAEVEQQLKSDLLTARAYELAKADATKLLEQARQQGLKSAAGDRPIVSAGPITNRPGQVVPSLALLGEAADRFVSRAFKLVSSGATTQPTRTASTAPATSAVATAQGGGGAGGAGKPVQLIELPRDGRVLVAELGDVQAMWTDRSVPLEEAQIHRALGIRMMQGFIHAWFDYNNVVARLKFVPEGDAAHLEGGTAPQQPAPPIL